LFPCCFAKNGCTKKIAYFNKKKHEKACRHGPCFCPEPGCGFSGPAATLPDHFTDCHKWPNTAFKYYAQFGLRLKPGPHVLRAQDGTAFLMNVVAAEPFGHAISLVCVQPEATESPFGCSVVFSCFTGHHQISTLAAVRCSSLADGLPKDAFCIVPKASGGTHVVLQTTIDTELVYDVEDELEDEDDEDESYDEDDEEDDSDDDQED
jgi:E3 ubiquitin-protein ligase SIAH1